MKTQLWEKMVVDGEAGLEEVVYALQTVAELRGPTPDITDILNQATYEAMFPNRNAIYTYDALVEASRNWDLFVNEGSLEQRV